MQPFSILLWPVILRLILPILYLLQPTDRQQWMSPSVSQRLRRQLARSFWRLARLPAWLPASSMLQHPLQDFHMLS